MFKVDIKNIKIKLGTMAKACTHTYSEGRDQDQGLRQEKAESE
jgi:hypothetical protein